MEIIILMHLITGIISKMWWLKDFRMNGSRCIVYAYKMWNIHKMVKEIIKEIKISLIKLTECKLVQNLYYFSI